MEFKGLGESSSGLELTIATGAAAGIDLNSLFESKDGGNGSNDENAAELEAIILPPPPHAGEKAPEDELTMRGVDVEGDAAGGGSLITRRLYRKLSREQNDELEAAFQQSHFIDRSTKEALAERLKITVKQVDVWFLNRRCRLRKQQAEETYLERKHLVEELKKKKRRQKRKIDKLKKRNKELLEMLATLQAAAAAAPAPPPQPSAPSVMLLPLTPGLNDALAAALNTQQGIATAAALPTSRARPLPPSGGSSSII